MGYAMYDIHHLIKEIEAHPDTLLVFEVHVKPKRKAIPEWMLRKRGGPHNGYPLTRFSESAAGAKDDDDDLDDVRWRVYGWSFV